jgi:hypothetical protein
MASPAPLGGSRTPGFFASVVVVLIALTGVAAFSIHPQGPSPSTFAGAKTTTTTGANGLLLGLSLNQTVIEPGQTVGITVYEQNTLKVVNNVSAADKWPVNGLSVGPCGSLDMPFGIVVYHGHVSVLSVPGVQPLQLYEPGTYNCPSISEVSSYEFQPMSTELVGVPPANVSSTIDAKGNWGPTFLQSSFSDFAPGIYTIIAGDEWGDVATLQFNVSSASLQTTSSETCSPAATVTQTLDGTTTTQVVTLCHSLSTYTAPNSSTATCIQTLSAPLYLIVKNDTGTPIPNQPLTIQASLYEGSNYNSTAGGCIPFYSTHNWTNESGPNGKIELGMTGDSFAISTVYLGKTYQITANANGAESAECVTLSLPSGSVNTTYSGMFDYTC